MSDKLTMTCFYDMRDVRGYELPNTALAYFNYRDGDYGLADSFCIPRGKQSPIDEVKSVIHKMTLQMREDGRFPEDPAAFISHAICIAVKGLDEYYREFPMTEDEKAKSPPC